MFHVKPFEKFPPSGVSFFFQNNTYRLSSNSENHTSYLSKFNANLHVKEGYQSLPTKTQKTADRYALLSSQFEHEVSGM